MSSEATIGVLAFQGDVIEHMRALEALGASAKEVRSREELKEVDGLIIPGGESTVIAKFLEETGLRAAILERCRNASFPIYGTCAGAILLAREVLSDGSHEIRLRPLGLMDITIERNAYGRQTESFETDLMVDLPLESAEISGMFIRAPKIVQMGKSVRVLARHNGFPVACMEGDFLVSTFHPELSEKPSSLHRCFLSCTALTESKK